MNKHQHQCVILLLSCRKKYDPMMQDSWVKIYASNLPHKISIVSAVLADNNIESHEINKIDSAYSSLGEIELYVPAESQVLALFIIKQNEL